VRLLQNAPFCPISASGSNFNPQNTQCIPVVKIITFLELEQKWASFKGLIVKVGIPHNSLEPIENNDHSGQCGMNSHKR
jgi:hypothetical protein